MTTSTEVVAIRTLNEAMELNRDEQSAAAGSGKPPISAQAGDEEIESSSVDKDLWVVVNKKLDMAQQCMLKALRSNPILVCVQSSMVSRAREGILSLFFPLVKLYLEHCIGVLAPSTGRTSWTESREGNEVDQEDGASLLRGKAERIVIIQPRKEKASG
ncbi:hypothetical protein TURU_055766 [Turdus rufiventris]|nr:hypothetical protein TURU_055766 [Turdus rufiventris]